MTSPLDNTNPYGIKVVADRAPLRLDVEKAFTKASRKATANISLLTQTRSRGTAAAAKASKRS
jgi:hypothetical protein